MAITEQLRRRGVDVLTAIEDGAATLEDDQLLARASELGRVLFTQDIRFKALAPRLATSGESFWGVNFWSSAKGNDWTIC